MKWTKDEKNKIKESFLAGSSYDNIKQELMNEGIVTTKAAIKHIVHDEVFTKGLGDQRLGTNPQFGKTTKFALHGDEWNVSKTYADGKENGALGTGELKDFYKWQDKKPDDILNYIGLNPDDWDLKKFEGGKHETVIKNNDGEPESSPAFSFKFRAVPKGDDDVTPEKIISLLSKKITPVKFANAKSTYGNDTLLIPFADLHFPVTKFDSLVPKIIEYNDILSRGYKKVIISQLGDLFQSDSMWYSRTANGTELGGEYDMVQAVSDAQRFFNEIISIAIQNSPDVEIRQISGNHSRDLEYMFMEYLKAKYPQVSVFNNIKYREAFMIDNNMVMQLHGDLAIAKAPMLMATEYKEMWAKATHRFCFSGHFHKLKEGFTDDDGVFTAQLGTIKESDNWEKSKGFTMADKELYAFEFNSNKMIAEYHI